MSSSTARNIVELRQLLAEKFPGVKMSAEPREVISNRWLTGVPLLDGAGGLPKGGMTEIVSGGVASGSSLLIHAMIDRAQRNGEWVALIDGNDSFDPTTLENDALSRLLWVRCGDAREAVRSADMLLNDGTLAVVVLDLLFNPPVQLRKIPSSTWFRLQRILDHAPTAFVVLCPEHMIGNAALRVKLEKRFSLESLEHRRETLVAQVAAVPAEEGAERIVKIA